MFSQPLKSRNQRKLLLDIIENADTGCWEWRGQVSQAGYGRVMMKTDEGNRMLSAHRASYELFVGSISTDGIIVQTCKNRLCINPEHLREVEKVEG